MLKKIKTWNSFWIEFLIFCVGAVLGFVFLTIFLLLGNLNAAIWGGVSGLIASILVFEALYIHKKKSNNEIPQNHSLVLIVTGFCSILGGISGITAYIALGVQKKETLSLSSDYLAAIWAFMTIIWGSSLVCIAWNNVIWREERPLRFWIKFGYACLGSLIGYSILYSFMAHFNNYQAAFWGGLSGIFATVTAIEHFYRYQKRKKAELPHDHTLILLSLGALGMLSSSSFFVYYITEAALLGQGVTVDSFYVVSVWCFMTLKWSGSLVWNNLEYRWLEKRESIILVNEIERLVGDYS